MLTSDNPRHEDPRSIVDMAATGLVGGRAEVHVEVERRAAIALALRLAGPSYSATMDAATWIAPAGTVLSMGDDEEVAAVPASLCRLAGPAGVPAWADAVATAAAAAAAAALVHVDEGLLHVLCKIGRAHV